MQLQAGLVKIGIGVSLSLSLLTPALASDDENCMQLMYDHGLASGAQFNCGYEFYNENIISRARQCMAIADEYGERDRLSGALASGLKDFNSEYESTDSKHRLCVDFAEDYPSFVHP